MFDVRLIPIAYGIGYVVGLCVAVVQILRKGTELRDEAAELPLLFGLLAALCYSAYLAGELL